ncbi:MAG: exonuclease sbcCD subunit D, partial [Proteiniphilum sp.]
GKRLLRKKAHGIDDAVTWLSENKDALVELTLVTDSYLTATDRRHLNAVHEGIISVIPEIANRDISSGSTFHIDLTQSMESLFRDYFLHEKGQEPNKEIIQLFQEILAEEDEK